MRVGAVLLVVVIGLFLWPALLLAADPPIPIEGKLLFQSRSGTDPASFSWYYNVIEGSSDSIASVLAEFPQYTGLDPSPTEGFYACEINWTNGDWGQYC